MARRKRATGGRPSKKEGPKLSAPDEVERLLVEGAVVPDERGEAKRVWLAQRDVAARFGVAVSTVAEFAKKHRTTERREALRAQLEPSKAVPSPKAAQPPKAERTVEAPEPSDVVRASYDEGTETTAPAEERRRPGRPRHQDAPVIPFAELDRLLVFGEVSMNDDGTPSTVYPTYRQLAAKYGVVASVIADYAKSHNTMKRRKLAEARVEKRTDEKIVELRSDALAFGDARLIELIDAFLVEFETALKEGRVRADSPADVNTLVRLRSFLQGGADSRAEVQNSLSLEVLSERHERWVRDLENSTPAMAGVVIDVRSEESSNETEHGIPRPNAKSSAPSQARLPPFSSTQDTAEEANLSQHLVGEVRRLVKLARQLAEQMGADSDERQLLKTQALGAAAAIEAVLGARDGAHVGARGANAAEDEG